MANCDTIRTSPEPHHHHYHRSHPRHPFHPVRTKQQSVTDKTADISDEANHFTNATQTTRSPRCNCQLLQVPVLTSFGPFSHFFIPVTPNLIGVRRGANARRTSLNHSTWDAGRSLGRRRPGIYHINKSKVYNGEKKKKERFSSVIKNLFLSLLLPVTLTNTFFLYLLDYLRFYKNTEVTCELERSRCLISKS